MLSVSKYEGRKVVKDSVKLTQSERRGSQSSMDWYCGGRGRS